MPIIYPKGLIKTREARYGWRSAICPKTGLERRIITCTTYEKKVVDGEIHYIEDSYEYCYEDDCNYDCQYREKINMPE